MFNNKFTTPVLISLVKKKKIFYEQAVNDNLINCWNYFYAIIKNEYYNKHKQDELKF